MLINNTTELKSYLPASVTLDFNDIRPKIKLVERETIQRIFSKALYDAVITPGATGDTLALREILAEAVAHLAFLEYLPFGQVQISSAGVQIASNANMKTAFEWQVDQIKTECIRQGWSAVEAALRLLEQTADNALKALWEETPTYQASRLSLISTLAHFEKFASLSGSRVMFNKLLPILQDVQEEVILPAIGKTLFDKILVDTTEPYLKVKKLASKALVYKTLAAGFMDTVLILSDNGPMIIDGMQSRQPKAIRTAPMEYLAVLAENFKTRAAAALRELVEHCQTNYSSLPEFADSSNFIDPTAEQQDHIPRNDPSWGIAFF
jgi:hypothetical protein